MTLESMCKADNWDCKEIKHTQRARRCLLRQQGGGWGGEGDGVGLGAGDGVGGRGGGYFEGLYAADGIEGEVQAGEAGQGV